MSEKFAEWFLEVRWPGAGTSCRWPIGKMTDADFLRLTAEEAPAAPLSTLPERPTQRMSVPTCTVCGKVATQQDIDGNWWAPCGHAKTNGTHTLEYLPEPEPITELETLRSRLSSLERELDGVRTERDQWHKAAESTLRMLNSANAALRERSE